MFLTLNVLDIDKLNDINCQ